MPPVPRPKGSVKQTPQGRWCVRWWTEDGRHPSRTFDRRAEADRFLKGVLGGKIESHRLTVKDVADEWWADAESSFKPRTADRYQDHVRIIERHLGAAPLAALDYDQLQDFVSGLRSEYAAKTIHHTYSVLTLILKHAQRKGYLRRELPRPMMPRVAKAKIAIPSPEQVEELADASQAWLYAAVLLAGYCGLRQGEILALHRSDVNLDKGWVFVHQARNKATGKLEATKTEGVRRVYMPARVATAMESHLDEFPGTLVFPVTASVFDKSWRQARTQCGLTNVRFHDLRHTAASIGLAAGLSVKQVSEQLGHANATMTLDLYGHLLPGDMESAMQRVDAYLDHA